MTEVRGHKPGTFCWVDLATTDVATARVFYGELFGWRFTDNPVGEGMVYSIASLGGGQVAGAYELCEEDLARGAVPRWQSYVAVESVDAMVEKVQSLGGSVLAGPVDVFEEGRMAVIRDPAEALLALWQPRRHGGFERTGEPGTVCWNELATLDAKAAEPFYMNLFGWGRRIMDMGEFSYTIFLREGAEVAGMMELTPECAPGVPSNWLVYFLVEDCDRNTEKARALGGTVIRQPEDIPNVGRFSVLQDPRGAVFALFVPGANP